MAFKELEKGKTHEVEMNILKTWEKMDILKQCIDNREGKENFVFYDGPATANGKPGLHHMMAKFLKDTFCKYKTMRGYRVLRKVGWDTHGLPVELQVEKELGFSNKKDIEEYGIKEFNQKCRESVWENEKAFSDLTKEMGQFIDLEHPYVTYDNNYIETEWWILKKFFDEGLFYEGHKILPYCTRCGTGLASHEVAQGYKEVTANTVIVPMKKKGEDVYFLVWTTTPWTLISNVALCVNPREEYVLVESQGNKFIVGKKLASKVLGDDYKVLEEYSGKNLEYMEYEQLIPSLKVDKKAFFVTVDDYVTMEDGTGIVHIAPAFGQDDYNVGKKYNLPVLNPVGEDGKYTEGLWKGMRVFDADIEVIKYLKENGKLFKKIKMTHNYPHCWRCDTPLLYYAKPSYYLEVTKIKDAVVKNNIECTIYGINLGGNEKAEDLNSFKEVFKYAKKNGLRISVHDGETQFVMNERIYKEFGINRIGHGLNYIENNLFLDGMIEVCLSSNYSTKIIGEIYNHPIFHSKRKLNNIVICTDDGALFKTNLARELLYVFNYYGKNGLIMVIDNSMRCVDFATKESMLNWYKNNF